MKRKRKVEKQAGVEGLIHTMSDAALRSAFPLDRRDTPVNEIPALGSFVTALRKAMPTVEWTTIERITRDLVVDEVVYRWSHAYDATARAASKRKRLSNKEMFQRERDRILKARKRR